ncbi:glycosyltransferase family 2 protein [Sphingobacterium faecium]|uniref:glycosyltransferase family 2 protein n=1 Tax=Sphingobacterium faecium TaxID=34087 RepID=UPI003208860D
MISVIIPLYNKESNIADTLNSVLAQSFKNFEIVIVNDGSTDNSLQVVEGFVSDKIRIFNQSNSGVSVARNKGILEAKYNWIALLDADDQWDKKYLEELIAAMALYPDKNIISAGHTRKFRTHNLRYTNRYLPQEGTSGIIDYIDAMSAGQGPMNSSNSIIRKEPLVNTGLFRPGQRNYEDHDVWMRLYQPDDIVFVNKNLVTIDRDVPNSASSNLFKAQDLMNYLDSMILVKNKLDKDKLSKFTAFYTKWCLYTVLKYSMHYTRGERKLICSKISRLMKGENLLLIQVISNLNLSAPFNLLNKWRKNIMG